VTAETAVVLPALVVVLVLALWAVSVAAAQLRCVDASRTAARALARGETPAAAQQAARSAAPAGSTVSVSMGSELVAVEVLSDVRLPGPVLSGLPGVQVGSRAFAAREPGR
jgi:Flp pilus assembly protein TadG